MKNRLYLVAAVMALASTTFARQFDEHRPSCAATPAELYTKPATLALLEAAKTTPILTLNSLKGVWQLQGIPFHSDKIGVNITTAGFQVQIRDIIRSASICVDENRPGWLRVSIHEPRCPENKNIYLRALAPNSISIEAYQTRVIGIARFRRVNQNPAMNVAAQAAPACARNFRD